MKEKFDKELINQFLNEEVEWRRSLNNDYISGRSIISGNGVRKALLLINSVITPERVSVINLLHKHGKLTSEEIKKLLVLPQTKFIYAMNLMLQAGIVEIKKRNDQNYYGLNREVVRRLNMVFRDPFLFKKKKRI